MNEQEALERSFVEIEQPERDAYEKKWTAKQVYEAMGLSRETLRYYERLHLIEPAREENSYRSFDVMSMYQLMIIDYYKKRGFRSAQLPQVIHAKNISEIKQQYLTKQQEVYDKIEELQETLARIEEDITLLDVLPDNAFHIEQKDFPLYRIIDQLSASSDFEHYQQHLLKHVDQKKYDLLGSMIREVSVDLKTGYQDSMIHIVEKADHREEKERYLFTGPCVYAIVEAHGNDASEQIMKKMFYLVNDYLRTHQLQMLGKVYILNRIIFHPEQGKMVCYHESYVPLL